MQQKSESEWQPEWKVKILCTEANRQKVIFCKEKYVQYQLKSSFEQFYFKENLPSCVVLHYLKMNRIYCANNAKNTKMFMN